MKFGDALNEAIGTGIGIYRPSWNGNANRTEGVAQFVETREAVGKITTPFFVINQPNGVTPWVPSQGDLFATDWETL